MAVSDYSTTPANNTAISGINIAEGCAPANINNAFRQLMADIKASVGVFFQAYSATLTTIAATGVTTAYVNPSTLVTEADGIFNNDDDTTIPTSAAVKDFFDGKYGEIGPTATTSGSNVDFTGIPEGVHEIDIVFDLVGLSGTDDIIVQLSVAAAFVTTGYVSSSAALAAGSNDMSSSTAGFIVSFTNAGGGIVGKMTLNRIPTTNYWVAAHTVRGVSTEVGTGAGAISLAGSVDGIRLDTTGTNTFDLGRAFVRWKFLGV